MGAVSQAVGDADSAAERSRARIETVESVDDVRRVIALFDSIWETTGAPPIGMEHMRALAHGGNYVVLARDVETGEVLGASVAFFAAPVGDVLHSDITGVATSARDRKLGFAIKTHQRAWALGRGIQRVTWTYDPLVARNAHFNLNKLRAQGVEYHVDFYGEMTDGINRGQGSDRMLISWPLSDPAVAAACSPDPPSVAVPDTAADASLYTWVAVPADIEAMRRSDPEEALRWRLQVRETLGAELAARGRVLVFDRGRGYLIERGRP